MRISEFITRATKALSSTSSTPRLDSELLLCHALKKERAWLFTWPEYSLTVVEEKQAGELLARRCAGEPVAYIIKQKYFWSLSLKVNRSTLIPGPDTERVVELALDVSVPATARVLDL
ncbi:MAG: protein-(glutamine-N5) methyltransferase, release factor-specific, partial [Endozoicomonadaceae bacterium]|nr:protein-(glutamine-N5) methyltransferase, release factor-specific [Endozoicomonadaceae bacterium]